MKCRVGSLWFYKTKKAAIKKAKELRWKCSATQIVYSIAPGTNYYPVEKQKWGYYVETIPHMIRIWETVIKF